jgi:Cu2+-exporting ATPase
VVFDKTGTLTMGAPEAMDLTGQDPHVLEVVAALAAASAHPLARSLATAIARQGIAAAEVTDLREVPGFGVEGRWHGEAVRLGRADWLGAAPLPVTATYFRIGDVPALPFTFVDHLRPGADAAVQALKSSGKRVWLISGDAPGPVADLAARLGIADFAAAVLPAEKAAKVAALREAGHRVLMVGDGLNDTAALAEAHVSISPAAALEAARVASDIVLLGDDLAPIADALRIAVQARRRMRENFAISAAYNVVAVPLALVGAATPLAAALAMSLSSITVSLNALRLK